MLPASDVKFLLNVVQRLAERRLHVYTPGAHRAAVALILRFGDADQKTLSSLLRVLLTEEAKGAEFESRYASDKRGMLSQFMASPLSSLPSSSTGAARQAEVAARAVQELTRHVDDGLPSSLRLLFMKRKDVSADRWSGQISFPGGLRDPEDADDVHTVLREVREVLGIPLESREFLCLGRLPDYQTRSRVVNAEGLVQARFVFLHLGDMTPMVRIADHEVDSVRWMPLTRLQPQHVLPHSVVHPLAGFLQAKDADQRLIVSELFSNAMVAFPSVSMPPTPAPSSSVDESEAGQRGGGGPCLPAWRVWGLTLRSASELLMLDDRPVLDWPLFSSNSAVLQRVFMDAFHGYYEAQWLWYRACAWLRFGVLRMGQAEPTTTTRTGQVTSAAGQTEGPRENATGSGEDQKGGPVVGTVEQRRLRQQYRDYHFGCAIQQRRAILPPYAPSLLYAVPWRVSPEHLVSLILNLGVAVVLVYLLAALVYTLFTAFRTALGLEDGSPQVKAAEARRRTYYEEQTPISVERARREARKRQSGEEKEGVEAEGEVARGQTGGAAAQGSTTDASRAEAEDPLSVPSLSCPPRLMQDPDVHAAEASQRTRQELAEGPPPSPPAPRPSVFAVEMAAAPPAHSTRQLDGAEGREAAAPPASATLREFVEEYNPSESVDDIMRRYRGGE